MKKPAIVTVEITGPTSSGKTAIMAIIKKALEDANLCVALPKRESRRMTETRLDDFQPCERPKLDSTIVALFEHNLP